MKRSIKGLILFIIILSLTFISSVEVQALVEDTGYVSISDKAESLNVGDLTFYNLAFKDNSKTSSLNFGLTGVVINSSLEDVNYSLEFYYYDANKNLIALGTNSKTALKESSIFNQMNNISILNGHSPSEIYYYKLVIITDDKEEHVDSLNTPSQNSNYNYKDYVIDKYNIDINVKENNTFDITETITAYFNVSKHGIYRTIPLKNTVTRLDGTTSKNRTQITNLSVDNEYQTQKENGNLKIQIGSSNKTITGEQTYVIKYTYNLGKDPVKDYDELYYNIIGEDWDTFIGNITFTITMPKEFDTSKLGFAAGKVGSTDSSKVKYNVSGNIITGSYDGVLNAGETLTVRCELAEGYFVGANLTFNIQDYIYFLIPIVFLGIAIFIWYKFGRDDLVVETVEFYPPEGFNSLEVGFLYKGRADNQDVISLLIYLANKGYLKIAEMEEKSLFTKYKGFKITKLKEYDGNNINEKIFFDGLFTKKPTLSPFVSQNFDIEEVGNDLNEATSLSLYNNFYLTIHRILANINTKDNKEKIFEKSASSKTIFIVLMIIATFLLITIPPVINYGNDANLLLTALFPGFGFFFMINMLFGGRQTIYINGKAPNSAIATKIAGLVFGGLFGGIPWLYTVFPALREDPLYFLGYILGLLCVVGMVAVFNYLPKRTKYGNEMLGKLSGFKNFLETVEKDKLEAMVMQNPTYFYDILPYTYVLGVSDKWIKKFETIALQAPDWYDSPNAFDMVTFGAFMSTTMAAAENVMASSPSSSSDGGSSGGSSGGGSSSGGSGGGGGGSW